jgi:SAM-dependent methyltransferase
MFNNCDYKTNDEVKIKNINKISHFNNFCLGDENKKFYTVPDNPLSDVVSNQYEQWMYPHPIIDLHDWITTNWQWFDPSHSHRMFWPNIDSRPDINILVAGCGTNQAAVLAFTNPDAKIVAIDVSQSAINHHIYLKNKYSINNLELHLLPIEEVHSLGLDFDLIISTGVLHHMADPKTGMKALASCLRPDGVVAIMLYAKYGRVGVEMLQGVFRDLGLEQNDQSVMMVKDTLTTLSKDHPIRSYISIAHDLEFDAGIVDTFLHGRERSYTIDDCLDLVTSSGLVFQDMFLKSAYYPPENSTNTFHSTVAMLPDQQQWSIMERINICNACHFFTACHTDRPRGSYVIDFTSDGVLDFVPSFRYRCGLTGNQLSRHNWTKTLDDVQMLLVEQVDGHRTIREIITTLTQHKTLSQQSQTDHEKFAKKLFKSLWRLDFLAIGLKTV